MRCNDPNLGEARFLLGKALLDTGDMAGAEIELRKALELKYPADLAVPPLAQALLGTGQAKKSLTSSPTDLPAGEPAASLKTTLSLAYLQRRAMTKPPPGRSLRLWRHNPTTHPHCSQAPAAAQSNKDISGALTVVDGVLIKSPNNHEALLLKGSLLTCTKETRGPHSSSIAGPESTQSRIFCLPIPPSSTVSCSKERLDDAATQVDALKKIAPKHPQTVFLEAQLAYQRKDYKLARELSEQLLKIAPNNPGTLQLTGAIEYQLRSYLPSRILSEPGPQTSTTNAACAPSPDFNLLA